MRKFSLFCLLVIIILSGCAYERTTTEVWRDVYKREHHMNPTRKVPPKDLKEDIDFFVATLEDVHPNPYHTISKSDFYKKVDELKTNISIPMDRQEFFIAFAPLVASLQEGHTDVIPPMGALEGYKKRGGKFFPFTIDIRDSKIFVDKNLSNSNVIDQGQEILAINSIQSDSILAKLKRCISASNSHYLENKVEQKFSSDLYFILGIKSPYQVTLKDKTYKINGVHWDTLKSREDRLEPKISQKALDYRKLNNETGLLVISSFTVDTEEYMSFIKESFKKIGESAIEHLIIDVSGNGGGDSDLADSLVAYFSAKPVKSIGVTNWKRSKQYYKHLKRYAKWHARWLPLSIIKKNNSSMGEYARLKKGEILTIEHLENNYSLPDNYFDGDVYVLSGPRTFSSAVIFLTIIKDYKLGTIVGKESGGNANHYGELYPFALPNSKLWLHTSTKHFLRPGGKEGNGGVKPDVYVNAQSNSQLVDETLKLINNSKK